MSKTTSQGAAALGVILILGAACTPAGPRPQPIPAPRAEPVILDDPFIAPAPLPAVAVPDPSLRGRSGALRVLFAMPGGIVPFPLDWLGREPESVRYAWSLEAGSRIASLSPRATFASWSETDLIGEPSSGRKFDGGPTARLDVATKELEYAPLPADHRLVAPQEPGIYELRLATPGGIELADPVRMVVLVPLTERRGARIEGYFVGRYPTEGSGRDDAYAPPVGLIRVTPELADLRLSTHFRLREFLTHDQQDVWPKFVLVDRQLLDKLELVLDDLENHGVAANHMVVMSGFRTPQYNRQGLDAGRASLSRHQWGDAADVWVDNDGDWYMDDLNGDGRSDTDDARVMLRAVDRVEARYPELIGGAGLYDDNGVHGPFIHIDARGSRARW